jgi:hypothetical protein
MKKIALITLLALLAASAVIAQDTKTEPAQKSADSWLALVDKGDYAATYEQASSTFKAAIAKDKWVDTLKTVRSPLGKLVSRKLQDARYTRQLPGVPDGEYVLVQYQTSFENKQESAETVVMQLEKDGAWKPSGYFIK